MNTFMKRFFIPMLCLVLLLSTVSGVAAQEEAQQVEVSTGLASKLPQLQVETIAPDAVGEVEVQRAAVSVSPAIGAKEQLSTPAPVAALPVPEPVAAEPTFVENNGDFQNAIQYMRDQMVARVNTFQFIYVTDYDYNEGDAYTVLFSEAMAHTGKPKEGDYLRWHISGDGGEGYTQRKIQNGYLYVRYCYSIEYYTTAAQEKQVDTAVSNLKSQLGLSKGTDYNKVKKIYDWMCSNITYDHTGLAQGTVNSPLTWSAYKGLVKGTCVCQGYASLFYRMALECGIDARFIGGIGNGGPHGWNIVELGGKYYNLDATWDAELKQAGYAYQFFLRSPSNFPDHSRDAEYNTSTFHSYYPMASSNYVPPKTVTGDMNGDGELTTDDAVYLLLHVMFGAEDYPLAA